MAIITARLLRKFLFKKDETPFVMELPPYRIPTAKATLRHMWGKAEQYLKKMGGLILVASIIIWFLSYYPRTSISDTVSETYCRRKFCSAAKFIYRENRTIYRAGIRTTRI